MKTIKVIDLLNKIANGGKLPEKIDNYGSISYYLYDKCGEQCDDRELKNILNYEVEILEEKKLPEKLGVCAYEEGEIAYSWSKSEALLKTKINEIIDYLESKEKGE